MADEYGTVVEVSTINIGTTFAANASVGATTITLADTSIFDELGGQVLIDGNIYYYTGLEATPASGSVTFDAVGPSSAGAGTTNGTTVSWSHTCGASGAALLVGIALGETDDTGISVSVKLDPAGANTSFVSLGSAVHTNNDSAGFIHLFGLANVASGAHTITATATATVDLEGGSVSYLGAGTTTGTAFSAQQSATGNNSTATLTFTASTAGNRVAGAVAAGSALNNIISGTSRWIRNLNFNTGGGNGAGADAAAGGSVTLSWNVDSNDFWGVAAVQILAASAPTGDNLNNMTLLTPLLTAATLDDTIVEIYPPAPQRSALVQFAIEEGEAVRVNIPYYVSIPDGVRTATNQENVLVTEAHPGELHLKDVIAKGMVQLADAEDLDNYTSAGNFIQIDSVQAANGVNFPTPYAGILEVLATKPTNVVVQRYTAYRTPWNGHQPSAWIRVFGNSDWSDWEPMFYGPSTYFFDESTATTANTFTVATVTDVIGTSISVPVSSTEEVYDVFGVWEVANQTTAGGDMVGQLSVDGVAETKTALWNSKDAVGTRRTISQRWRLTGLTVGTRTLKLRVSGPIGVYQINTTRTTLTVQQVVTR